MTSVIVHTAGEPDSRPMFAWSRPSARSPSWRTSRFSPDQRAECRRRPRAVHLAVTVVGTRSPKAERDYVRTMTVPNPTQFFVFALRDVLEAKGVAIRDGSDDIDLAKAYTARGFEPAAPRRVLFTHLSPPLSEIGVPFMKVSQNLYGETLLNTIGIAAGSSPARSGGGRVPGTRGRGGPQGLRAGAQRLGRSHAGVHHRRRVGSVAL